MAHKMVCACVCVCLCWPSLTFRVLVEVCDVSTLVRAHCLGANVVAYGILLRVDLSECAISIPLPVDFITVHLQMQHNHIHLSHYKMQASCFRV